MATPRSRPAAPGPVVSSVVTRRGLEITRPTPNTMVGCLFPLIFFLAVTAFILWGLSDWFVDGQAAWMRAFDRIFGWWWLALGALAAVLNLAFSSRSNTHIILDRKRARYQHRMGRIVLQEDDAWLTSISEVVVEPGSDDGWTVRWRGRGPRWYTVGTTDRDGAEALAARIRAWVATPGALPVEQQDEEPTALLVAETAFSLVGSRLTLVFPFVLAAGAVLLIGAVWQLHEARTGRADGLPRYDRVTEGELAEYRWFVHTPFDDSGDPRLFLRVAIDYTAADGETRRLWLRSRPTRPLSLVRAGEQQRAVAPLGVPAIEFDLPEWTAVALEGGDDWTSWRRIETRHERAADTAYHAARLLGMLDDPYHYLVALWSAPAPDWRVAYVSDAPERAMLARWVEAERAALARVPVAGMYTLAGLAVLVLFLTVPPVITSNTRRRYGKAAVLAGILAAPVWASHADRAAHSIGVGDWLLEGVAGALRYTLPESARGNPVLIQAVPPARDGHTVRWTPDRSGAGPLLDWLDLGPPTTESPPGDSTAVIELLIRRAEAALARLSDPEMVTFAQEYERGHWFARAEGLHTAILEPALCAVVDDAARGSEARTAASRLVYGRREPFNRLCALRAGSAGDTEG